MGGETVILLVFGGPFLILCLIYAVCALYRRGRPVSRNRNASTPRIYISQQVPSVFTASKGSKK